MPRVPSVAGPSVAATGLPDAYQTTPRALGGAQSVRQAQLQSVTGMATEMAAIQQREVEEMEQVRVDDAINRLKERQLDLTFGKEAGFTNARGLAALERKSGMGLADEYSEELRKAAAGIGDGLGSERQKRKFGLKVNDILTGFRSQVLKHEGEQANAYNLSVRQGKVELNQTEIARFYNDTGRIEASLNEIGTAMLDIGRRTGKAADEITFETTKASSAALLGAVSGALADNKPMAAQALLDKFGDRMTPADRTRAAAGMKEMGTRAKAQSFEDEMFAKGAKPEEALAEARSRFKDDPLARDAAVAGLKTRFAERSALDSQAAKQVSTSAWSVLMAKGSMSAIPADMMNELRTKAPEEERQMRDWLEAKWRRSKADAEGKGNEQSPENIRAFIGLVDMATERPFDFAQLDLARYQPYLTKQHFDRLITMRAGIGKSEAKAMSLLNAQKRTEGLVMAELRSAGIDTTPKEGSTQATELMAFRSALNDALSTHMEGAAAPLDEKKMREIGLGLLRQGIEQGSGIGGFFQTKKRGYQIAAERATGAAKTYIAAPFDQIPAAAREQIVNDLRGMQAGKGPRGALSSEQKAAVEREYQRRLEEGRIR